MLKFKYLFTNPGIIFEPQQIWNEGIFLQHNWALFITFGEYFDLHWQSTVREVLRSIVHTDDCLKCWCLTPPTMTYKTSLLCTQIIMMLCFQGLFDSEEDQSKNTLYKSENNIWEVVNEAWTQREVWTWCGTQGTIASHSIVYSTIKACGINERWQNWVTRARQWGSIRSEWRYILTIRIEERREAHAAVTVLCVSCAPLRKNGGRERNLCGACGSSSPEGYRYIPTPAYLHLRGRISAMKGW